MTQMTHIRLLRWARPEKKQNSLLVAACSVGHIATGGRNGPYGRPLGWLPQHWGSTYPHIHVGYMRAGAWFENTETSTHKLQIGAYLS